MLRRPVLTVASCMRFIYSSVSNYSGLPRRNLEQDCKRIKRLLQVLRTNEYDHIKVPSVDQLVKCLYVTKPLKVALGLDKQLSLRHMNTEGRQLLKSEFLTAKNQFNIGNMTHLAGLQKSLIMGHRIGEITYKFLQSKNISNIARIPIPENRLSKKVLAEQDLKVLHIVLAYLSHCNSEAAVRELVQNEVTKPALRNLFGL